MLKIILRHVFFSFLRFDRHPLEMFPKVCEQKGTDVFLFPFIIVTIIALAESIFLCIFIGKKVLAFVKDNNQSASKCFKSVHSYM